MEWTGFSPDGRQVPVKGVYKFSTILHKMTLSFWSGVQNELE
ncbi:hypothetical protein HMPREF1492_0343 [Atopobium sp. BS2]|nr:hypothetical protein HMPREF1492_0343 [Atopobium sp. BS2]